MTSSTPFPKRISDKGPPVSDYPTSLRQQAKWIEEALDPATPETQRIDLGDVDLDELRAAADVIERLEKIEAAARVLLTRGLKLKTSAFPALTVVEHTDKSDPHHKLCELLNL